MEKTHTNLSKLMSLLYDSSYRYTFYTYIGQIVIFSINLYIIIKQPQNSNQFLWTILLLTIIFVLINYYFARISKNRYQFAESIRKMEIIRTFFHDADDTVEQSYILSKIPKDFLKKSEESKKKNENQESLIELIQLNCFFTSGLMRSYSKIILIALSAILFILVVSIIYGFYMLSESNTNTILSKSITSYLSLFVNFIFALNVFNHYQIFKNRADELEKLDKNLTVKHKTIPNDDTIVSTFSEYNCVLNGSLAFPNFIYNNNEKRLNKVWNERKNRLMISRKELIDAFEVFCSLTATLEIKWVLTGSFRLFLEDENIMPKDIDIITTKDGIYKLQQVFSEFSMKDVQYSNPGNMRSYFGQLKINNVRFDLSGDLEENINGKWINLPEIANVRFMDFSTYRIPVFDLEYELEVSKTLKNVDKENLISNILAKQAEFQKTISRSDKTITNLPTKNQ